MDDTLQLILIKMTGFIAIAKKSLSVNTIIILIISSDTMYGIYSKM